MPILFTAKRFQDERGYFSESYNVKHAAQIGITCSFVQDNQSYSKLAGTMRGLHFQLPPFAQAKLVRVVTGKILDIVVDIRRASPTFGQHVRAELSAENGAQIFIPAGYAHGFITLVPDTEVFYKADRHYNPASEGGLLWSDPDLNIDWTLAAEKVVLSPKDQVLPKFADFNSPFEYDGQPMELKRIS